MNFLTYGIIMRFIIILKIFLLNILILSNVFAYDVVLEWEHDGNNCIEYRVYRSQGGIGWPEQIGIVDCGIKEFIDVNIPYGNLNWIVTTYYDNLESNTSNETEFAYYYAKIKYDYGVNTGRLLYKGENADLNANDSDTDWIITKYYYNSNGFMIENRVRETSWTNRTIGW